MFIAPSPKVNNYEGTRSYLLELVRALELFRETIISILIYLKLDLIYQYN